MAFEVQQTRWDRLIRRVSGSIGPGSRVAETLGELFPVFDVEQAPAELLALGGTRMAMGRSSVPPAGAGLFTQSMLLNPVGSNAIITLLSITAQASGLAGYAAGITQNVYTNLNAANTAFADGRLFPDRPVGEVRDDALLVQGVEFFLISPAVMDSAYFQPPKAIAVLTPGSAFSVSTRIANVSLFSAYTWIERPAEESELSL